MTSEVWNSLSKDDFLCQFLDKVENKNPKSIDFNQTLAVTEQLSRLTEGISLLDKELQHQVLEKHEDLVGQASWAKYILGVMDIVHLHVQRVLRHVERIRMKVVEPFSRLESQTLVLARLHATSDLLRRAVRIQQLAKRLPGQEALRAAHIIAELDELQRDVDLTGLDMLESEQKLIKKETNRVEQQASKIFKQGLESLNSTQVNIGLEIYIQLGVLEREINKLRENSLQQIGQNLQNALDMNSLVQSNVRGGAGRVTGGLVVPVNIQNFRSKLWAAWDNALNTSVYPGCAQIMVVHNVLNNKGDIAGNFVNEQHSEIAHSFWAKVNNLMSSQLENAAKGSSYIKQALEGEYPKLLRLHIDLLKKLKALDQADSSNKPVFDSMGKTGKQFETAYLSRSLKLQMDSIKEMFPEGDSSSPLAPPSTENVDTLVKTISSELSVSLVDEALTKPVSQNIGRAVTYFCQRGEQMIVTSGEATQVIKSPKPGQELNVNIANIVFYLCQQVQSVITNLGLNKSISANIIPSLNSGQSLIKQILGPLVKSINQTIEAILLTMHNEDFDIKEATGSSSLYMKELHTFISRAVTTYLLPFHSQQLVAEACIEIASRTLELFLRHASLVRPISDAGRKKLLADFKSVEEAVSPLCSQLSELGSVYSVLRSLRPLVVASPQEVATSPVLGQVIPYSLAITTLFSRGPPQLPSPHKSLTNWSVAEYSEWLDKSDRTERDRLEVISGALRIYQEAVCKENQASFHPVYPVMVQLLEKAAHHNSV